MAETSKAYEDAQAKLAEVRAQQQAEADRQAREAQLAARRAAAERHTRGGQ